MKKWGRLMTTLAILTVFYLLLNRGRPCPTLEIGGEAVVISARPQAEMTITVRYDEIRSLELLCELDEGGLLDGGAADRLHWGLRDHELYGTYQLCIDPSISRYIRFETAAGSVIFNLEDSSATEESYAAFERLLAARNAEGSA